eukprot:IDg5966t1
MPAVSKHAATKMK